MQRAPLAVPRRLLALATGWVLVLHPVLEAADPPVWLLGPVDWSAHLAVALLLLANLAAPLRTPVVAGALAAVVIIDLDHLPQHLGTRALTEGTPRPYGHSLATVAVAAAAALALHGRARQVAAGIALGVLAHLVRDIATGPGIAPLWPLTDAALRLPFWMHAVLVFALAARAWARVPELPHTGP